MTSVNWAIIAAIVSIIGILFVVWPQDSLLFTNYWGEGVGVLIDGKKWGADKNDDKFSTSGGPKVSIGNFQSSPSSSPAQIIAFSKRRPPTVWPTSTVSVNWTSDSDALTLEFEDQYPIPVYIWIAIDHFDTRDPITERIPQEWADDSKEKTNLIWLDERQGFFLHPFLVFDRTSVSGYRSASFSCGSTARMKNDIGFIAGGINVYVVHEVENSIYMGAYCSLAGESIIIVGRAVTDHLLAHELGHALLGNDHIDCWSTSPSPGCPSNTPYFDRTNVMHGASPFRNRLTEGQSFRAIFNPTSAINAFFNARPGLPTASLHCGVRIQATAECPEVQRRIWDDEGEENSITGDPYVWPSN
ncbi:MAG TPA: hypothetical protein VJL88_08570 [Nitrospira sp.]|nr:hypothetical protein [Nitrospira sp.]